MFRVLRHGFSGKCSGQVLEKRKLTLRFMILCACWYQF